MKIFMPTILTNLGECFKTHATPEMTKKAKSVSTIAVIQVGIAAMMYYLFMKMREIDEKKPQDISRETLSACTCAVISPGATSLAQQARLIKKGFDSIKTGVQKKNPQQVALGLALTALTYIVTTNFFASYPGMIEGYFRK